MTAAPAFGVSGTATTGFVPTVQADGSIAWAVVPTGAVASVFGRTGTIVAGNADYLAVKTGGLTGATAAVRYVGGTASGAPASGTFAVGDFANDQQGNVFICVTAGTPGVWTAHTKSNERLSAAAAGIIVQSGDPNSYATGAVTPATQVAYGVLLGLHAATTVTGVVLRVNTGAAGTLPTTARFGIADSTGKILALSGNLNALSQWASGPNAYAFTSPYVTLADGGYFACFVVNGAWSVTQPTIIRGQNNASSPMVALGANAPPNFSWNGQADLPNVGSSLTLTQGITQGFYMAFY